MRLRDTIKKLDDEIKTDRIECNFCFELYPYFIYGERVDDGYYLGCDNYATLDKITAKLHEIPPNQIVYYWVGEAPSEGRICDDCIDKFIAKEKLTKHQFKECGVCKTNKKTDDCYYRKGTIVRDSNCHFDYTSYYYPYSDKYTLSEQTIFWCEECGDKVCEKLVRDDFMFKKLEKIEWLIKIARTDKKKHKYCLVKKQMILKKQLNIEFRKR